MVPAKNDTTWKRLVTGEIELRSTLLGMKMFLTNSRMKYKNNPSPANLQDITDQMHEFFVKFESMYHAELKQITG